MKKETRFNLWFLAIFVAISLPGAVVLFYKKLSPGAPRLDEPDPVLNRLPYMATMPAPPDMAWFVPPLTEQWLKNITRQQGGGAPMLSAVVPGPDWEPVISPDHRFQVIALRPDPKAHATALGLILWDPKWKPEAGLYDLQVQRKAPGGTVVLPSRITGATMITIPADVRHELVGLGFEHPPTHVVWVNAQLPLTIQPGDAVTATLIHHGSGAPDRTEAQFIYRPS